MEEEKGYLENRVREIKLHMVLFIFPLYSRVFKLLLPQDPGYRPDA